MKPYQFALGALLISGVIHACTPLPDLEEDKPLIAEVSPIPIDQIDASGCPTDGAPDPTGLCKFVQKK